MFEKYDRVVLGVFSSEEEAHTVYEERVKELGEGGMLHTLHYMVASEDEGVSVQPLSIQSDPILSYPIL